MLVRKIVGSHFGNNRLNTKHERSKLDDCLIFTFDRID